MDSNTVNLITLAAVALGLITLGTYFNMVYNTIRLRKYQQVQMEVMIEMALQNGVEADKIDGIKNRAFN